MNRWRSGRFELEDQTVLFGQLAQQTLFGLGHSYRILRESLPMSWGLLFPPRNHPRLRLGGLLVQRGLPGGEARHE
jgi:hypothetical protein